VVLDARDEATALEVDQERWGGVGEAIRQRDEARILAAQGHDAHREFERGEQRAVRGVHAEAALGIGHDDAPVGQERHGLDAARSLERERGVVFAHDPHRTVQRAARHRVAGIRVRERDDADGRVVLQRAEQPASGRP
jgi:hypothetical protein